MKIPRSHPRYESLMTRNLIVEGVKKGIASEHGLIAHGRGEAFDYLIGEKTNEFAKKSIEAAAALLVSANHPVISVNGNTAALVPRELAELSMILNCPLEVNLFHSSRERELKIMNHLRSHGAANVLLPSKKHRLLHLDSNRKFINPDGILKADVVFVPLEDGDRAEALAKNGKKVIVVDLNPISRTSKNANITIVDNLSRVMPLMIENVKKMKNYSNGRIKNIISNYNNENNMARSLKLIRSGKL